MSTRDIKLTSRLTSWSSLQIQLLLVLFSSHLRATTFSCSSHKPQCHLYSCLFFFVGKSYVLQPQTVCSPRPFSTIYSLGHQRLFPGSLQQPPNCLPVTAPAPILSTLKIMGRGILSRPKSNLDALLLNLSKASDSG